MPDQPSHDNPTRATYYFDADHHHKLEVVMLKLRTEHGLRKIGKSDLARFAFGLMAAMPLTELAEALKKEGAC